MHPDCPENCPEDDPENWCELCQLQFEIDDMTPGYERANAARCTLAELLGVPALWEYIVPAVTKLKKD